MIRRLEDAARTATGYALSAGTMAAAVAGFPIALGAGVALYVALHHTPAGRASMALFDDLNGTDQPEQEKTA